MREKGSYFLGLGLLLMVVGFWRQELLLVLEKAISICLQCIGIG